MRPPNAINVLDTHDGIGVIDVGADARDPSRTGLLAPDRIHDLVETIHDRSGGVSRAATGSAASNVDLYQVNCTFYDALGRDDDRYLAARMIQCMLPGTPQIYYVGLLAGTNDVDLLARTGVGRDVNRHYYTPAEIDAALARPVVQRLLALLRWRATEPAFDGSFETAGLGAAHARRPVDEPDVDGDDRGRPRSPPRSPSIHQSSGADRRSQPHADTDPATFTRASPAVRSCRPHSTRPDARNTGAL